MSAISYSAPIFTEKNEKEELAEITEEEKREALKDVYGRQVRTENEEDEEEAVVYDEDDVVLDDDDADDHDINANEVIQNFREDDDGEDDDDDYDEDEDVPDELLEEFNRILDEIPIEKKVDYLRAVAMVPDLVEVESDPKFFLRAEDYDPEFAAERFVEYWKLRVQIFQDSAFEPMTFSGAMNDTIPCMKLVAGCLNWLPDDEHGRAVLCFDRSPIMDANYDQMSIVKYFWFALHVGIQKISTQKKGIVIIVVSGKYSSGFKIFKRKYIGLMTQNILGESFPVKVCCVHHWATSLMSRIQMPIIKFFMTREQRQRYVTHTSFDTHTVLSELESYDLKRENLPSSVGGTYKGQPSWMEEVKRIIGERQNRNRREGERAVLRGVAI